MYTQLYIYIYTIIYIYTHNWGEYVVTVPLVPLPPGDPGDLPELDHGAGWLAIHHR